MKTDRDVSEAEFLAFLGSNALSWSAAESNKLVRVFLNIDNKLKGWNLPLPPTVMVIKTTGMEEGQAAYTRGNAIIVPRQKLGDSEVDLNNSMLHELFSTDGTFALRAGGGANGPTLTKGSWMRVVAVGSGLLANSPSQFGPSIGVLNSIDAWDLLS